ncbi:TonB-dependent receptor [Novosphingobium sp. PY1]|nr:TonB-dependent receptor [Novosphingobium sp. PY1]
MLDEGVVADGSGGLQDIVVTAQKRSESVNTVPLSITALGGDALAQSGVRQTEDLANVVPGLSYANSGFNSPVYTLRGIGYNDGSLLASPTVSIYVDEVPLPYAAMTKGALLDVQRVEVLKGPQGTLYGSNSTGGAINYIANRPTSDLSAGLNAEYGRFGLFSADGYVSGPVSDRLRVRVSASTTQGGDWQKSFTRDDKRGASDKLLGRIIADWEPLDTVTVTFGASGWHDESDTQAPQAIARVILNPAKATPELLATRLPPMTARAADWNPGMEYAADESFYQLFGKVQADLGGGFAATAITAYSKYKVDTSSDRDGVNIIDQEYNYLGDIGSLYQEVRGSYSDGDLTALVGANYRHDTSHDVNVFNGLHSTGLRQSLAIPTDAIVPTSDQKVDAFGLFGDATVPITDWLNVAAGLRYSKEKREFTGCSRDSGSGQLANYISNISGSLKARAGLQPNPGAFVPGGCVTMNSNFDPVLSNLTLDEDNVSIKAGINIQPERGKLFYISFNRGYKSGGFPNPPATSVPQLTPVSQERVDAYEAGFKLSLFDRLMQVNGAVFRYDYADKQLFSRIVDATFGPVRALVNIPRSRVNGAELQVDMAPAQGLRLTLAGTYIDTKVLEGEFYSQTNQRLSLVGRPFNFSPKWQLNGSFSYETPVSETLMGFAGGDVTYRSSATADFNSGPLFDIKPYALVNGQIGVKSRDDRWSVAIFGRNLTNTYYYNTAFGASDFITRYTGKPVTYGLRIGVTY